MITKEFLRFSKIYNDGVLTITGSVVYFFYLQYRCTVHCRVYTMNYFKKNFYIRRKLIKKKRLISIYEEINYLLNV